MFYTRLQTPAACPIRAKCGCSVYAPRIYARLLPSSITSALNADILQNGATEAAPFQSGCLVDVLLFHARVLLHRLGRYGGRGLGAVANLRVGSGRADGAPCLA